MIVENDPTSLAICKALLQDEYELILARSGHQALGALKAGDRPDLFLLDLVMTGFGGMELLQAIKSDAGLKEIPVVFLSGEHAQDQQLKSYLYGAADYLHKPVDPDMLKLKIRRQTERLDILRENRELKTKLRLLRGQFDSLFHSYLS